MSHWTSQMFWVIGVDANLCSRQFFVRRFVGKIREKKWHCLELFRIALLYIDFLNPSSTFGVFPGSSMSAGVAMISPTLTSS